MSLLNKAKSERTEHEAQEAWDTGDQVLVLRVWDEVFATQPTGRVKPASEALERATAIGWKIQHVAYAWSEKKNRGLLIAVLGRS